MDDSQLSTAVKNLDKWPDLNINGIIFKYKLI